MRHLHRTHRVAMDRLHETCTNEGVDLRYINTHQQIADILTKHFTKVEAWQNLCGLLNVKPPASPKRSCTVLCCIHAMPGPPLWAQAHRQAQESAAQSSTQRAGGDPVHTADMVGGAQSSGELQVGLPSVRGCVFVTPLLS